MTFLVLKIDDLFSHRYNSHPLRLPSHHLSSVLCMPQKWTFIKALPLDGVTWGGPPPVTSLECLGVVVPWRSRRRLV